MTLFKRTGIVFFLFLVIGTLSGCQRIPVTFPAHRPYVSEKSYPQPLTIVVPDGWENMKFETKFGDWSDPRKFEIYYGQGLRIEAESRLRPMFSTTAVVDVATWSRINGLEPPPEDPLFPTPEPPKEDDEKPALTEYIPTIVGEDTGYVVFFEDVEYVFLEGRGVYQFSVRFQDRFTDEVLVEGRFRAVSDSIRVREASHNITGELQRTTRVALATVFRDLSSRIATAIEAPPQPE